MARDDPTRGFPADPQPSSLCFHPLPVRELIVLQNTTLNECAG